MCCYHGDAGAPLEPEEINKIQNYFPFIKSYLSNESIESIKKHGLWVKDRDGDIVTPLVNNKACAYAFKEQGIYFCAFEKAWSEKKINFQKPLSCHLYPIRIKSYKKFDAVNYDPWKICKSAVEEGKKKNIRLYQFLQKPIIRKYDKAFYKKLDIAAKEVCAK